MKRRLLRTLVLSVFALIIGGGIAFWQVSQEQASTVSSVQKHTAMPGVQIGGAYELVDHNGQMRTDKDFLGRYKLIYFGFTYCPAICPTELQKISAVMAQLPLETAAQIQPLFITIDPQRDTVAVMNDYISLFDERLIGLTGTPEQIESVKKTYRVYAKAVQEDGMTDYTMDHSSYIYFMSPDDQLLGMYRMQDDVDYVTTDVISLLK
jgi:protein SCO1/2